MDGPGFDALTRAFSSLRPRRGVAQLLLGAVLGGTPALLDRDETEAKRGKHHKRRKQRDQRRRDRQPRESRGAEADKKKGKKKPCPPCKKRKQGKCKGKLPDGAACSGGSCRAGSCVPTTPPPDCTPSCGGRVCGGDDGCGQSCGTCPDGLTCDSGQCVQTCGSGLDNCAGTCVDLQTDVDNCGTCGKTCSFPHASAACQGGACTLGACDAGWANCNGGTENGCETNIRTDLVNCGACGTVCAAPLNATATCANGGCGFTCNAGFHRCGNECVSNNDVAHCGDSCTACPTSVCSEATCDGMTCGLAPIPGCCGADGDCDDDDPCTTDTCGADHTCQHTTVVCPSSDPCQDPVCDRGDGCTTIDHCQTDEVCIAEGAQAHCCPQARPLWDGSQCAECLPGDLTRCDAPPNASSTCSAEGTCGYVCEAGFLDCGPVRGCETGSPMYPPMCGACDHYCVPGEECVEGNCRCGGGEACTWGQRCCDGVCRDANTDVNNCGLCGNVCPGIGQPTVNVACTGGFCSVSCKGQNYDVNNDWSDGCEQLDEQANHTQDTALDLGAHSCLNTDTGSFEGTIYSDSRGHGNPPAPGFVPSPTTGAAPLWFRVTGSGGACERDLRVELTLTSGTMNNVYSLTVITDTTEASATVSAGSAIIALAGDSYTPGSTIYFKVEKTVLDIGEMASFTALFHL